MYTKQVWRDQFYEMVAQRDALMLERSDLLTGLAMTQDAYRRMIARARRYRRERDALREALTGIVDSGYWQQTEPHCGMVYLRLFPSDWQRAHEALGVSE
jgi:hypothetical protein